MIATEKRSTGTYVMDLYQLKLIEVDRIDDKYYYRNADDRDAHLMNDSIWESIHLLDEINDNDLVEPGFYFVGDSDYKKDAVEIVKYNNSFYFRPIGSSRLHSAHSLIQDNKLIPSCMRVEADHLNVSAIIVNSEMLDRLNNIVAVDTLIENMNLQQ